ncbi:MAG: hypothetical protein SGARI_005501, partial [Bacillariaceae sp.]
WYTEKYRRDEDDIDGQIKKMYRSDIREAHDKLPQMTATIRGQDMRRVDQEMNKMVWGGKAALDEVNSGSSFGGGFGGGAGSNYAKNSDDDDSDDDGSVRRVKPTRVNIARSASEAANDTTTSTTKKRKRRKRKGKKTTKKEEKERIEQELKAAEQKLVMKSTFVGVALGAVAVAAVTLMSGRSSGR